MSWLITVLRDVPDPRTGNATRHELLDILMMALTASICGCEGCVEFAEFCGGPGGTLVTSRVVV